jgi:HSP20 family protein
MTLMRLSDAYTPSFSKLVNSFFGNDIYRNELVKEFIDCDFCPAINISEIEKEYIIELSTPGFKKEDIKIEYNKDLLTIYSDRKQSTESTDKFWKKEFNYKSFKRSVSISEDYVNINEIKANYEDGILTIKLPKRDTKLSEKIKKIEIQ